MIRFSSSFLFFRLCYLLNITVASLIVSKFLVLLGLNWHWPLVNIAPSQKPNSQLPFHIPNKNHAHFLSAYCSGQGALGLFETGPPRTRSNFIPPLHEAKCNFGFRTNSLGSAALPQRC